MSWQAEICEKLGGTLGVKKMEKAMYSILEEMLESGCDPNEISWMLGDCPIWMSILEDKEVPSSIISLFLENGAKIPIEKEAENSALFKALENEFGPEVIALLLDHGADATFVTEDNTTALHYACSQDTDSLEIIKILVEHGCPVDQKRDTDGSTPLGRACLFEKDIEVLQYLIEMGADVNSIDDNGDTPLISLCYRSYGAADKLELLLAHGATIDVRSNEGYSALGIVCKNFGDSDMVQVLVKHGLDVNGIENGNTMAMLAAEGENWDTINKLVELGFNRFDVVNTETEKTLFDMVTNEECLEFLRGLTTK